MELEFECVGINRLVEHGVQSLIVRFDGGNHNSLQFECFGDPEQIVGRKYKIMLTEVEPVA